MNLFASTFSIENFNESIVGSTFVDTSFKRKTKLVKEGWKWIIDEETIDFHRCTRTCTCMQRGSALYCFQKNSRTCVGVSRMRERLGILSGREENVSSLDDVKIFARWKLRCWIFLAGKILMDVQFCGKGCSLLFRSSWNYIKI